MRNSEHDLVGARCLAHALHNALSVDSDREALMSVVRLRAYAASPVEAPEIDHVLLFKEDYPRRIDRVIR